MDSFSSKPEPKLKSDIFKGISSNPPNSKQNQSSTGMSLNKPISPSGYDPFSSTGASKGLPKPNKVDLGKPGDIFSDMDPFNSNNQNTTNQSSFTSTKPAAKLSDPFNNFASSFSASKPSQDSISFKTQTINMTSGFKSMSDGSDPFAEILGEEKKEEPKINTFASFGSGFDSNKEFLNFNQAKKTPPPTNAPYPKQTSVGGSSSDPFGSFLNSTQKQSKPSGGSMSLGGSSGIGGKSAFSLDPQPPAKTPSFPSDSFSTGAPRTGSFKSTTGVGMTFPNQPTTVTPPAPGFAFPGSIDMNAPMDQNTMNMMLGMMNTFSQQFNNQGSQPGFNPFSFQSNQASGGTKPPSSGGKGLFD